MSLHVFLPYQVQMRLLPRQEIQGAYRSQPDSVRQPKMIILYCNTKDRRNILRTGFDILGNDGPTLLRRSVISSDNLRSPSGLLREACPWLMDSVITSFLKRASQ